MNWECTMANELNCCTNHKRGRPIDKLLLVQFLKPMRSGALLFAYQRSVVQLWESVEAVCTSVQGLCSIGEGVCILVHT